MKIKYLVSVVLLSGGIMGAVLYTGGESQKIRGRFSIQESYCAIKTNGVTGIVTGGLHGQKMAILQVPPHPVRMP
jgi:hypothetical protein